MPVNVATLSKATIRGLVARADREVRTTTGAGSTTTVVCSAVAGRQVDFYRLRFLLMTSGDASGQWRTITNFASDTGTFTIAPALSASSGSGNTFEVYTIPPHFYTLAVNQAIPKAYPSIYKPDVDYVICTDSSRRAMGVPRGILDTWAVGVESEASMVLKDLFDRADSTSSIGGSWTATTGTWGISSERGYSVTDADADFITYDADLKDGMISCIIRGTLNHASTYRSPALAFRIREDYLGAISSTTCLIVRLLNGAVQLRKNDAGTETNLTTATTTTSDGVDYVLRVRFEGPYIRVWLDDVEVISYELTGLNLKYLDYPRVGIRWDKGGSPATAARVDDYRAHRVVPFTRHHDWRLSADKQTVEFGAIGQQAGLAADRWIRFEGGTPLTLLTDDSTEGTLDSDSTARLEIESTDPALPLLVELARAEVFPLAADPSWNGRPETWDAYRAQAAECEQRAAAMRDKHRQPRPARGPMFPIQ